MGRSDILGAVAVHYDNYEKYKVFHCACHSQSADVHIKDVDKEQAHRQVGESANENGNHWYESDSHASQPSLI